MISQQKRASVVEEQDISPGIRAVQPKVGSVLAAQCMAILQFAAETSTERHLRWEEDFVQRTPVVIVRRSEDRQTKWKIMWRVAVKKKTWPLRLLLWKEMRVFVRCRPHVTYQQ